MPLSRYDFVSVAETVTVGPTLELFRLGDVEVLSSVEIDVRVFEVAIRNLCK